MEKVRKREDQRIEKENIAMCNIYQRSMNYDFKITEDIKAISVGIFRQGFGVEKRKQNYLKNKKITSQVHAQFINNDIIEDEDQMPFMQGYIMDSDSESSSDTSYFSSESEQDSQSNSQSKTGEDINDTINKTKLESMNIEVDAKLTDLFNKYYLK